MKAKNHLLMGVFLAVFLQGSSPIAQAAKSEEKPDPLVELMKSKDFDNSGLSQAEKILRAIQAGKVSSDVLFRDLDRFADEHPEFSSTVKKLREEISRDHSLKSTLLGDYTAKQIDLSEERTDKKIGLAVEETKRWTGKLVESRERSIRTDTEARFKKMEEFLATTISKIEAREKDLNKRELDLQKRVEELEKDMSSLRVCSSLCMGLSAGQMPSVVNTAVSGIWDNKLDTIYPKEPLDHNSGHDAGAAF